MNIKPHKTAADLNCPYDNPPVTLHPCPYSIDVGGVDPNDSTKWCDCCKMCEGDCTDSI